MNLIWLCCGYDFLCLLWVRVLVRCLIVCRWCLMVRRFCRIGFCG